MPHNVSITSILVMYGAICGDFVRIRLPSSGVRQPGLHLERTTTFF